MGDNEKQSTEVGFCERPESQSFIDIYAKTHSNNQEEQTALIQQARPLMETVVAYKELRMIYNCALKEIRTKFDVLNTDFNIRYQRNPISSIKIRLKSTGSLGQKLERQGKDFTIDNIEEEIHDLAGIRVICSYVDDIYLLADALIRQDDITLIHKKDYIANPKPNGYRSLHLIVSVPVFFADQTKNVKVEVQIRTIAMDFWASLEHQIKYKKDRGEDMLLVEELKDCADVIADTDTRMLALRKRIEARPQNLTDEELILQKLNKLDTPLE